MRPIALLAVLALSCSPSSDPKGSSAGPDLLVGLPGDAALVVVSSGWSALRERAPRNAWVRLFAGETWRDLSRALREWMRVSGPAGLDPLDALSSVEGLAASLTLHGPDLEPGLSLLVRPAIESAGLTALEEWWLARLAERGPVEVRTHDGAELWLASGPFEAQVFFRDSRAHGLAIAASAEDALALATGALDRLRGTAGAQGIVASSHLSEAFQDASRDDVLRVFADGPAWFRLVDRHAGDEERALLEKLGLRHVGWAMAEAWLGKAQSLGLRVAVDLPADTPVSALLGALRAAPLDLLDLVPESALGATVGQLDAQAAFAAVEGFLRQEYPSNHEGLQRDLGRLRQELGVDLRQDVLGNWDGSFALFATPATTAALMEFGRAGRGPAQLAGVGELGALVRLADPALLQRLARRAAGDSDGLGFPAAELLEGCAIDRAPTPSPLRPQWTVQGGRFLFALGDAPMRSLVERCTGREAGSLGSRPGLHEELAPYSEASLIGVTPARQLAATLCNLLRGLSFLGVSAGDEPGRTLADLRLPSPARLEELHGTVVSALRQVGGRLELVLTAR